jgi:hypothetical protein
MSEYVSGSSIRAEKTPPRKATSKKQMVDFRGFPLSTEEGNPLTTEKQAYPKSEYGADNAPSVVLDSESFFKDGVSSQNLFSKRSPAAVPIEERFQDTSQVARSLLGINRETTQQGLFGNVSTYGLDEKDWKVDGTDNDREPLFWWLRPSAAGNYYFTKFKEDTVNSALAINAYPSPYTPPSKPSLQDQLLNPGGAERYRGWGEYINSIIAQYLIEYMVKNFSQEQRDEFNLTYLLNKYPPNVLEDGSFEFNRLYWDKIWLDIRQSRFGDITNYPILPEGFAYNFNPTDADDLAIPLRDADLWGENQSTEVIITAANAALPTSIYTGWDSFFFNATRVYYPKRYNFEDKGHYLFQTNPRAELWEKYFGLRWDYIRQDLKDWKFTIHESASTVTQVEKDFKLPYFILKTPVKANETDYRFSNQWPAAQVSNIVNLPTSTNKIGGNPGVSSQISIKSVRAFRYQPGRISGFTYGSKASEIGAGPGTTIEWGIENDTDAYFFRLKDGADFTIVRRSIIPLDNTTFLEEAGYLDNTTEVVIDGKRFYETIIEQKNMNGDPLSGAGQSGYILDIDTVTMYKIEFGWYGAIGAKFYAYIPQENGECRWVAIHTLVIENQLGQPCLGDPFFYFKYRLIVEDSSTIRLNQFLYKFGASYYIDGFDDGTLYSSYAKSKKRELIDPKFTESKTYLNATDYTVLMGIKPKQYLYNRFGSEIYNKKEIFPKSFSVFSQEDCEIKIIRQEACPEFAYMHQEGYSWELLPEKRRVRGKFSVNNFNTNEPDLSISEKDATSHTATLAWAGALEGDWRDPRVSSSYPEISTELTRIVGDDLFQLAATQFYFSGINTTIKLQRVEEGGYFSSRNPNADVENVYLPFTYAPTGNYINGYEVEFDYFRRDQTLLSSIDIISDEFFLFWTGGSRDGVDNDHSSTFRVGFAWPDAGDANSLIHPSRAKNEWGIETPDDDLDSLGDNFVSYDGEKFYEGLPVDFVNDYSTNTLFVETNSELLLDTYNLEIREWDELQEFWELGEDDRLRVTGVEGGRCNGVGCKAGRELREGTIVMYEELQDDGSAQDTYYVQSERPWLNLGEPYDVTASQGINSVSITVDKPISKVVGDVVVYLLPIGPLSTLQSLGLSEGDVEITYNVIYIATIDKKSQVRSVLVSKVAPGDLPFVRMFVQARQGTKIGGMWIGQKTPNGIILDPFTPNRSTVNIKDSGTETHGESFADPAPTDGAIKGINTFTQIDNFGKSTAPTLDSSQDNLDTYKSTHSSPKKCGSFLSAGGTNSAGILTPTDYPIRWLTNDSSGLPLGTFYISKNESVEISLDSIFNVNAESIVNSDDANLATIFIARSLNNHSPEDSKKEIYMTLNYDEQ